MRPDLIGERCEAGEVSGVLVRWDSDAENVWGMLLLDDGRVVLRGMADLRFPPRTAKPDELREAADALLTLLTLDDIGGRLAGVDMDTRMAIVRLQEALQ